jgi:hypothetical protein
MAFLGIDAATNQAVCNMGLQEIEWVILGRFCLLAKGWIEMVERLALRPLGERLRLGQ